MPSEAEPLFLWGAPGSGKTTVGTRLAAALGRPFADVDALIVAATALPISALFAERGEAAFRRLESAALAQACAIPRAVIALGGGTLLAAENRARIAQGGRSIYLRASVATLEARLVKHAVKRPLLATTSVGALIAPRLPLYAAADFTVDVDAQSVDEIVEEICALL